MATLFSAPNAESAWRQVCTHLLANDGECYDAMISIQDPTIVLDNWLVRFNPRSIKQDADLIRDVANTIFPLKTQLNTPSRSAFYVRYKKAYDRRKHRHHGVWGTYFHRLISFGASGLNQLERAIVSMRDWEHNHKAVVVLHTSSSETDGVRTRGGPCLQYVQFNCPDSHSINLLAVYRNHDYFNKALGNFVGLGRLLSFVASETNRDSGRLTCVSAHAYFDVSRANMQALLAR